MNCPKCGGDEVETLCLLVHPPIHLYKCLGRNCRWAWQKEDTMPKSFEQRLEELETQIVTLKLEVAELRGFNRCLQANRFPEPAVWPSSPMVGSPNIKDMQVFYDTGTTPPKNGWSQIDTQAFEDKHAVVPTTDHDESPDAQTAIQQAQHADDYLQANVQ